MLAAPLLIAQIRSDSNTVIPTCRPIVFPSGKVLYPRRSDSVPPGIGVIAITVFVQGIPSALVTLTPNTKGLPIISVTAHEDQESANPFESDLHALLPRLAPSIDYKVSVTAHDSIPRCGIQRDYNVDLGDFITTGGGVGSLIQKP